jgi:hypothetical protein
MNDVEIDQQYEKTMVGYRVMMEMIHFVGKV